MRDLRHRKDLEARFQLLIEGVADHAIFTMDAEGVLTSWNEGAQRLFGYTAGEVVGKSVTILIPQDRQDEEPQILDRIRRGERVKHEASAAASTEEAIEAQCSGAE